MLFEPLTHYGADLPLYGSIGSGEKPAIADIANPCYIATVIANINIIGRLTTFELLVLPPHTDKIVSGYQRSYSILRERRLPAVTIRIFFISAPLLKIRLPKLQKIPH